MVRNDNCSCLKLLLFLLTITFGFSAGGVCAELLQGNEIQVFEETQNEPLVLKLMVVNPSQKFSQTFSLKAYLPDEVKPEFIIDSDGLDVDYDSAKSAYYVHKKIELEVGESVVKSIKIKDIWYVTEETLNEYTSQAHELIKKLRGSDYEERGRLLIINIETLLLQIYESQNDKTQTPDQHISTYRDNVKKMKDVEMDLMMLRRFSANSGSDLGFLGSMGSSGGSLPLPLPSFLTKGESESGLGRANNNRANQISPVVLWRLIFLVLGFMGIVSLLFFGVWHHQLRVFKRRKRLKPQESSKRTDDVVEGLNLDDFFQQKYDPRDSKKRDAA